VKKRTYEISLIGLGAFAVATLAFGLVHRAGKARHETSEARERSDTRDDSVLGELPTGSAEGEALSTTTNGLLPPLPVRAEPLPRDEALAEIWGTELPDPERAEVLALSDDLAGELETRGDTYDGIEPEDLGAEWLARATESASPQPTASHRGGELAAGEALADAGDNDPDDVQDDDLDRA
jgi:hypothetical protein